MMCWKKAAVRRQLPQGLLVTSFVVGILIAPSFAAMLSPIGTSGHDQDLVFETGLAAGAVGANGELGSRQFFEDGATSATDDGLPRTLPTFTSALTGNTIDFAFQPFEQNNILKFDSASGVKTLSLVTPQAYSQLAVAFSGGSLASTEAASVTYTINYAGGLTQTGTFNAPDWGAVTMPAGTEELFNADRTTANATMWPITSDNNTTAGRWSINVSQITTVHPLLNIESVSFGPISLNDADGLLNSGDDVVVYGLSGVPEPASWALALLCTVVLGGRQRRSFGVGRKALVS